MDLKDKVALVTGGASGLGEATVRRFVADGAKVVIVDMNDERGNAVANELGDSVQYVKADVSSESEVQAAVDAAKALGDFRVAVSCAGVGWAARTLKRDGTPHDYDLFKKVIEVNLVGTFNVLRLSASAFSQAEAIDGERGVVINTASIAAYEGQIGQAAYSASKGGVVGMTLPIARDLSKTLIRVATIAPGTFNTPMVGGLPEEIREALAAGIPNPRRLGNPAEFASLAAHIVSNGYLNGEVIRLDGALRMQPK